MSDQRIPVMQLIDGFATVEHSGGASQFGIQLARHLDRTYFAPFVCGLWQYGTLSEERWRAQLEQEGIGSAILIEKPTMIGADMLRAAALLHQLLERVRPLVINSHFERGDLLGLWSKLRSPLHPQIVRTMHTDQQWQTRPWLGRMLNLAAFPWLFDSEVAISRAVQVAMDRRIAARPNGRQAVLIYNGISSALLAPPLPARPGRARRPARPPRIAIIGRLEQQKGHRYFMQAGVKLLRRITDLQMWIVGCGSLKPDLEAYAAKLGIAHATQFLNQRDDVPEILGKIDLLVSSSLWEGFPTVILEAMAARVPVVATNVSGSRELVRNGETGLLVPAAQPEPLAAAMLWILENPSEAERLTVNAWHQVHAFTIERAAQAYDRLYCDILGV